MFHLTTGDLVYLDFGMMSTAPEKARYAIINHVTHLVNRDYDVRRTVWSETIISHHHRH